jgi:hypothetical protein
MAEPIVIDEADKYQTTVSTTNPVDLEGPRSYNQITTGNPVTGNVVGSDTTVTGDVNINLLQHKLLALETTVVNMENKIANIPSESVYLLKEEMQSISNESHRTLKSIISNELKDEISKQNTENIATMMKSFENMMSKQTTTFRADLNNNHHQITEKVRQDIESIKQESTAQNDELYEMMNNNITLKSDILYKRMESFEKVNKLRGHQRITRASTKIAEQEQMIMFDTDEESESMDLEKELYGDNTVVSNKKNE